jgi:hypothetical protein
VRLSGEDLECLVDGHVRVSGEAAAGAAHRLLQLVHKLLLDARGQSVQRGQALHERMGDGGCVVRLPRRAEVGRAGGVFGGRAVRAGEHDEERAERLLRAHLADAPTRARLDHGRCHFSRVCTARVALSPDVRRRAEQSRGVGEQHEMRFRSIWPSRRPFRSIWQAAGLSEEGSS